MLIYKITNTINSKVYIGQTIRTMEHRWSGHKSESKNGTTPLYRAMRKHGIDKFTITEIGGANSLSELNYQEWILIHLHNSLHPNGYNMIEGGGARGKLTNLARANMVKSQQKRHDKNPNAKKVINTETGEIYKNTNVCAKTVGITYNALRNKLNGNKGNNTPFRYVGKEHLSKPWIWSKGVVNIKTRETWESATDCARYHGFCTTTLIGKLRGKHGNETNLRYIGMEDVYKKCTKKYKPRAVVDTKTGEYWNSFKEAAKFSGINYNTLYNQLNGHRKNKTNLIFVEER